MPQALEKCRTNKGKRLEKAKIKISKYKSVNKFCENCGERLILNNNRDIKRKRFCSKSCCSIETSKRKPKKLIFKKCYTCGKVFESWPSQNKKYCSDKCFCLKPSKWKEKGYIQVPDRKNGKARVGEHILIAENALGRDLKKGEVVHHINLIKDDNRNSNLIVCNNSYHSWLHNRYALRFAEIHLRG